MRQYVFLTEYAVFFEKLILNIPECFIPYLINEILAKEYIWLFSIKDLRINILNQNDELITTKQLVEKESFVRLKIKVELRKDIMTILYQINIYENNKIDYKIEDVIKEVGNVKFPTMQDVKMTSLIVLFLSRFCF